MRIKEKEVKELILRFQETNDIEILKALVKETSDMIYHYPLVVFHKNLDECSEFYIYFIERFSNLIKKYNSKLSSFNTWFNIILKSHCINWLNSKKMQKRKQIKAISINKIDLLSNFNPSKKNNPLDNIATEVQSIIEHLPELDYLIIKLLYYNIDKHLLKRLSLFNKRSKEENLSLIDKLLNNNKKFEKQQELIHKILNMEYLIKELKIKLEDNTDDIKIEKRLKRSQHTLSDLRKSYYKHLENFDINSIAQLLNCPINSIYNRFNKTRQYIYNLIKNSL